MNIDDFDPAINATTKNIANDLYATAKNWINKLDPTGSKLQSYREGIDTTLGKIQIMGMAEPRKLTHLYISLKTLERLRCQNDINDKEVLTPRKNKKNHLKNRLFSFNNKQELYKTIKEIGYGDILTEEDTWERKQLSIAEEKSNIKNQINYAEDDTMHGLSAIDIINKNPNTVILGQPGSGKTTFMKYLALAYSGLARTLVPIEPLLPIFVPLRELKKVDKPTPSPDWLLSFIYSCASETSGQSFQLAWLKDYLKNNNCIILLDGVDEIDPESINEVMQSINSFARKYRGNKIVTTCRSAVFEYHLEGFKICEIDDFNSEDIEAFLKQWFNSDKEKLRELLTHIKGSTLIKDLCKTPLLLTMICILFEYNQNIPNNRFELYETCVDALFFRWDSFRFIKRPSLTLGLGHSRKKMILSRIARETFDGEVLHFSSNTLESMLENELIRSNLPEIQPSHLLKELESHNGLFIEKASNVYTFSHLTFQEFFTALAYHDDHALEELLDKVQSEPRYREVFLMALERSYEPDGICLKLAEFIKAYFINERESSDYHYDLITKILRSNISIHPDIRKLLNAIQADLLIADIEIEDLRGNSVTGANPLD